MFQRIQAIGRCLGLALGLLALGAAAGKPLLAAASPWLDHEHAKVRLISAVESVGASQELRLGLQFELAPGWKIYWRSPGDAGFPPAIDWSGSRNLAGAEMRWPVPHRFSLFGIETFGYSDRVVLPMTARLGQPGAGTAIQAAVSYLACAEICVPHDGVLTLDLPAGDAVAGRHAFLIDSAERLVPDDGTRAGLRLESVLLTGKPEQPGLRVVARAETGFDSPDLLVEGPEGFFFGKPRLRLSEGGSRAELTLTTSRAPQAEGVLEGKLLTLTLIDGNRGLETTRVSRHDGLPSAGGATWLVMLGLALIGGLILNLMPCVLPVLSIKLLSVVGAGGRDRRDVRLGFLASAAGIVSTFLLLAAGVLLLKAAGVAVGWGIQFQAPLFLSAMAVVITLFACNLFGFFEIPLPGWLGGAAARADGKGLAGHFLAGGLATLLATPCSAPFLGTAIGFALARGPAEILSVFAALGVGLAAPYLLIALRPVLAARLPRPGHWMVTLRRLLGLALLGTAVWLLSVLAVQVGWQPALIVAALLGLFVLVLYLNAKRSGRSLLLASLALALVAFALPAGFSVRVDRASQPLSDWRPLDEAEIARLVGEGQVVFVDVTADWCITCKVNKSLVLERDPVAGRLGSGQVTAMRGDWTLPSDRITAYLASFGRYGIPFNAVYGPGTPQGRALPELLTSDAVLAAMEEAAGGKRALP